MTPADFLAWRSRLGLTQAGAAEALGISPRQVWNYENGRAAIPRLVELACSALDHEA